MVKLYTCEFWNQLRSNSYEIYSKNCLVSGDLCKYFWSICKWPNPDNWVAFCIFSLLMVETLLTNSMWKKYVLLACGEESVGSFLPTIEILLLQINGKQQSREGTIGNSPREMLFIFQNFTDINQLTDRWSQSFKICENWSRIYFKSFLYKEIQCLSLN